MNYLSPYNNFTVISILLRGKLRLTTVTELVLGLAPGLQRQDSRATALNCYSIPTPNIDTYSTGGIRCTRGMHGWAVGYPALKDR